MAKDTDIVTNDFASFSAISSIVSLLNRYVLSQTRQYAILLEFHRINNPYSSFHEDDQRLVISARTERKKNSRISAWP